ncbi:MAG: putative peptidoglycan glycosyltransferase FtsW [Patescibacteria group bacterium]
MIFFSPRRTGRHVDYLIVAILAILVIFGLVMLGSASSHLGETRYQDSYYYLKHQIMSGLIVGIVGFFLGLIINYTLYRKIALPALLISIALLALVFTPLGVDANNATRWVKLGLITFQPAEILKITLIIYLASWLANSKSERQRSITKGFIPLLIVLGVVGGMLIKQPATSIVVVLLGTGMAMYFTSGAKMTHVLSIIGIGVGAIALVIALGGGYRLNRIKAFLNPEQNAQGSAFHINQALIAVGSGQMYGVGYGESTTKLQYLPEPMGDSIFAIIAEEFGFVGAITLVGLFLTLVIRVFILAWRAPSRFASLLLIGFATLIAVQSFIHIGAISGIIPLTGMPLPFISYGGTALAVFMTIGGIIVNISKHA